MPQELLAPEHVRKPTTIHISKALLEQARSRAEECGKTFSSWVHDLIEEQVYATAPDTRLAPPATEQ